jgi:Glycosyltransferase
MSKGTIIYIGGFELPDKNAASHRPMETGKIFKILGYDTVIIGVDKNPNPVKNIGVINDSKGGYDCWTVRYPRNIKQWINYLTDISDVKSIIKRYTNVKYVICYNYQAIAFWRIQNYCRKNNITVLADCTEWYGSNEGSLIFKLVKTIDTSLRMKYINKRADAMIVASKYLKDYYSKSNSFILPMLFNHEGLREPEGNHSMIKVAYAGVPFRLGAPLKNRSLAKDRLDLSILLLYNLHKRNVKFTFNIYGITKEQYLSVLPDDEDMLQELEDIVFFHGYMKNADLRKRIQDADFTVLIREENRVTMAGFPTKFSESIMCGTPVVTTKTSDLEDYLDEGENGYFLNINDIESATDKFEGILKLDREKILELKKNCADYKKFSIDYWIEDVRRFF